MNDFGSSAWSAVVTVSTTKKPQTSEDLQRAVTKGDVETVRNILSVITPPLSTGKHLWRIVRTKKYYQGIVAARNKISLG